MKKVVPRIQRPLLRKMQGAFSFYAIGNCAAFPMTQKSAPHGSHCGGMEFVASRDAHSREEEICRKRPRSARECAKAHSFLFYRKFLKSSEMVYNEQEIKNDITKERREASR